MQLDNVAVALRPRSAWESIDLGVGMLQQWWRTLYASFAPVYLAGVALAFAAGWAWDRAWVSLVVLWWLKPVFDRVALHVVSRAVFGEAIGVRRALAEARAWLGTRLAWALTLGRIDMARSGRRVMKFGWAPETHTPRFSQSGMNLWTGSSS